MYVWFVWWFSNFGNHREWFPNQCIKQRQGKCSGQFSQILQSLNEHEYVTNHDDDGDDDDDDG